MHKPKSLLIGNGFDVQLGGDDYLNKWIIVRMLAKAKMGKYDILFTKKGETDPLITGDEIITLLNNLIKFANDIREEIYDAAVAEYGDKELEETLQDFKNYHDVPITSVEEIGMENWFMIFLIYLLTQKDILDQYGLVKQGFERMICDAIFCEGNIQSLHRHINKNTKLFLNEHDSIFTLNYGNEIEKATGKTVFHLHGDFSSNHPSEDESNAVGFLRIQNGENVDLPLEFQHCNNTAILDFSGNKKYKYATTMTKANCEFERIKLMAHENQEKYIQFLDKLPLEHQEIVKAGVENDLSLGVDYYFEKLENLSGELEIIGLATQNDKHIFKSIEKSNIEHITFYTFFNTTNKHEIQEKIRKIRLPLNKPYVVKNVQDVWKSLKQSKPHNIHMTLSDKQVQCVNAVCPTHIEKDFLMEQINSIPKITKRVIVEMMKYEIAKEEYRKTPESEKALFKQFVKIGKTLEVSAISPQALYALYFSNM